FGWTTTGHHGLRRLGAGVDGSARARGSIRAPGEPARTQPAQPSRLHRSARAPAARLTASRRATARRSDSHRSYGHGRTPGGVHATDRRAGAMPGVPWRARTPRADRALATR